MNSITNLIVAIILACGFSYSSPKLHRVIKKEAMAKVNHGLTSAISFIRTQIMG